MDQKKSEFNSYEDKKLLACVERILDLPSFPTLAIKALSQSMEDDVDFSTLASLVEPDPSLVMKILKRANSSEKKRISAITDVSQAISLIGLSDLQCILLSSLTIETSCGLENDIVNYQKDILSHSLGCGLFAYLISKKTYPELRQESFAAGILHDIGKIGLLLCTFDDYLKCINSNEYTGYSLKVEQDILGFDHTQLGKKLAEKWNMPNPLIEVIFYHHLNGNSLSLIAKNLYLLYIVKLANILAHEFLSQSYNLEEEKDKEFLIDKLQLTDKDLQDINANFLKEYSNKASLLELEDDIERICLKTIEKANKKVADLVFTLNDQKRELTDNLNFQRQVSKISLLLSKCTSVKDIFQSVASVISENPLYKAGLVYILDRENWILEGHIWHSEKKSKTIRCFLDKEGKPIWDQQTSKFPQILKELFSSFKDRIQVARINPIDITHLTYKSPFYTMPIYSDKIEIEGELCLAPSTVDYIFSEAEKLAISQIVKLIAVCLENLKFIERLEKKNEELSFALWKNQQLQKNIINTERLAIAGQLAAGAAHEINNPLAVINARAQMLQIKESDPTKRKYLNQIMEQIERISSILTRLMDFARPAPPSLTAVNLHTLLDKVLDFVGPGLRKHNISVVKDYFENLPIIKADPSQLEQVFLNLIINAQHAMEEKGGNLTITTHYNAGNKQVVVEIIDEGIGIDPKQLKHIFEPFFTTKSPGKGTGLGLAISHSIIENHYGKLEVTSKKDYGTTVRIILPTDLSELREIDSFSSMAKKQKDLTLKPSILIVDDEKHIREILSEALEAEGMETTSCSNGAEALELIGKRRFDLILLDMKMPILDGIALINAIKRKGLNVPIIVITGMATHEEIKEALCKGVYKCIKKPFHIKALLKDIQDVLKQEGFFAEYSM